MTPVENPFVNAKKVIVRKGSQIEEKIPEVIKTGRKASGKKIKRKKTKTVIDILEK